MCCYCGVQVAPAHLKPTEHTATTEVTSSIPQITTDNQRHSRLTSHAQKGGSASPGTFCKQKLRALEMVRMIKHKQWFLELATGDLGDTRGFDSLGMGRRAMDRGTRHCCHGNGACFAIRQLRRMGIVLAMTTSKMAQAFGFGNETGTQGTAPGDQETEEGKARNHAPDATMKKSNEIGR